MKYSFAIVRAPGKSYRNAISSTFANKTIDVEKAKWQHEKYCEVLAKIGFIVIKLPTDELYPDGCFVQDPCVIYGNTAIMTIPGAASRQGEGKAIEKVIKHFKTVKYMKTPATMDGGDVMVTPKKIFIGLSKRSNEEGIRQYQSLFTDQNIPKVIPVPIDKCLHLMTGVTYIEKNTLVISELVNADYFTDFNKIEVNKEEEYAANCLLVNDVVLVPRGFPKIVQKIKKIGYEVIEVEMSEFKKADGGVTCLSLLF